MKYLEQLTLHLIVDRRSAMIDGIHLNNEVVNHMPQLQTFIFDIVTYTQVIKELNRQSSDDIQRTFRHNIYHHVVSYVEHYSNGTTRSHIYSHAYTISTLKNISNGFPVGIFTNIRKVSLVEILCSFEHEFFVRISRAFPLLNHLKILNRKAQRDRRPLQLDKNDYILSIVQFPHLVYLEVHQHIDYAEQFLVDTNIYLPRLIQLKIDYEHLEIVTENFTRDTTRFNCVKLERIDFGRVIVHSEQFYQYFPFCK